MVDDSGSSFEIGDDFRTYEDFLDSQIKPLDLYYLQDQEVARQLVELGHKGSSLEREEFETMKAAAEASRLSSKSQQKKLANAGKELKDNFLRAMAEREEANRSGEMTSIIFIRDRNSHGQEISGYIDYSHRLKTEDFEPYFSGKKKLLPRPTDLSFYNWKTRVAKYNASLNYEVITENLSGLLFENKEDRKILNVDPEVSLFDVKSTDQNTKADILKKALPGDSSVRIPVQSDLYVHVVFYDHILRKP